MHEYQQLCLATRQLVLDEWGPALPFEPMGWLPTDRDSVNYFSGAPQPIARAAPVRKKTIRRERPKGAVAKVPQEQLPPPDLKREPLQKPQLPAQPPLLRTLIELCPAIKFSDTPPADDEAQKIAQSYKLRSAVPQILLLYPQEPKYREFFDNLAQAIEICFGSARCFETSRLEESWDKIIGNREVKLVIGQQGVQKEPAIAPHFEGETLGKQLPILLIDDLSKLLGSGLEKRNLWTTISQIFD